MESLYVAYKQFSKYIPLTVEQVQILNRLRTSHISDIIDDLKDASDEHKLSFVKNISFLENVDNGLISLCNPDEKENEDFQITINIPYHDVSLLSDIYNHYNYLELVINDFWISVFDKSLDDSYNGGIVAAHGDKGRGYKSTWESVDISFNRGMLLYLLTYTNKLEDTPKFKPDEWVINNYLKYLPFIKQAEIKAYETLTEKFKENTVTGYGPIAKFFINTILLRASI